MIHKDLDPFTGQDKFSVAGRRAEEQMAFYLRRFFGSSAEVDVLNYLRIELEGEVAQMDHLILHPFGLLIVESKSVVDSVQIESDGQWIRWYNNHPQGMRSPITQARMQAMLLKALLDKKVKQTGIFDRLQLDVLVAISDQGRIQWPASGPLPEVCKADQVHERIQQKLEEARRAATATVTLSANNRQRIADFLCAMHKPLVRPSPEAQLAPLKVAEPVKTPYFTPANAPSQNVRPEVIAADAKPVVMPAPISTPEKKPLPPKTCKHCGSIELEATYGKFGYYFVCRRCEKNTAIKFTCPACGGEGRLRKAGKDFFAECKACDASSPYHSNEALLSR
jgi:Nuclease-related domain